MSSRTALFGRPQASQTRHLLQFKAGKMTIGDDNWVHADPRKGWVYVYQSGDGKLHFCWIDRKTCLVEDNFIINAKQAEFKRIPQCTTGRVYLLKFKDLKHFFIWMQEPNGKNDSDICTRINDYIRSPPAQTTALSSDWLSRFEGLNQLSHSDLLALLCKLQLFFSDTFIPAMGVGLGSGLSSESEIPSAQSSVTIGRHLNAGHLDESNVSTSILGAATTPSSGASPTGSNALRTSTTDKRPEAGKIQLQDLRNILSSISTGMRNSSNDTKIELYDVLNVDNLHSLLNKPDIQERLLPHLPPLDPESTSTNDLENLTTNIQSSQFKTTLKSFSAAFRTGELAPVLAQFSLGIKADEAARRGDLVAFSNALQQNTSDATFSSLDGSSSNVTQDVTSQESSKKKTGNEKDETTASDSKTDKKNESFDDNKMDTD
ncbi:Proteasomal ubiquitin receptor ADRM1-A [Schistosoma japonicum]|nr:Proteasomal ubiquitin receptor ADRM1-A [Schistosoma japonicum]